MLNFTILIVHIRLIATKVVLTKKYSNKYIARNFHKLSNIKYYADIKASCIGLCVRIVFADVRG